METHSSSHKNPPWRTTSNCFTQLFTYFPLSKLGISNKLIILVFTKPSTHCFGYNTEYPNDYLPKLSIYTYCENYENLLVLDMSCSAYYNLLMQPSKLGVGYTPSRMRGKMIEASGCLCEDCTISCFPFICVGVLDVPTSCSLSSQPNFGFTVISLICTSLCYVNPIIGCGLFPSYSFLLTINAICFVGCYDPIRLL
jgi:hypothetical protein